MHIEYAADKRWQILVCKQGTVHVHYGTGSLHIMKEDFLGLAREMQKVAESLESRTSGHGAQCNKEMIQ